MAERQKYRVKWFRLVAIVLIFYFAYLCVSQQSQLNAISKETENVRGQLAQFQQANATLKAEKDALQDPKYIEKVAREELGLVKPGESPYVVVDKK
jgi:cell division protein FtsL